MKPIESVSFATQGLPESRAQDIASTELRAFMLRLERAGWRQCGQGKKWFAYDMKLVAPATAAASSRQAGQTNLPQQECPRAAAAQPTPKSKSGKPLVQRIKMHRRRDGMVVFRFEAADEFQILESIPFPATPTIESTPSALALSAHLAFVRFLKSKGWERRGTITS
jgi:hypothetical protein